MLVRSVILFDCSVILAEHVVSITPVRQVFLYKVLSQLGVEHGHEEDTKVLHSMGYAQELSRRMGGFSNFAISFSIICILAGGITSFPLAMGTGGAFEATIGWVVGGLFALLVAASLGQIASAYPTAGALYHWSSILGGRGWGWATAWINLLGLIFVVASVDVGVWQLFRDLVVAGVFHVDVTSWTALSTDPLPTGMTLDQVNANNMHAYYVQVAAVTLIVVAQALVNHFGIKLTTILTDFSGYLILVVAVVLTAMFLIWGARTSLTSSLSRTTPALPAAVTFQTRARPS